MGSLFSKAKPKNPHLHDYVVDPAHLQLLRNRPELFFGAYGLAIAPGHPRPANNRCSVTLSRSNTSNTQKINIIDQGPDWYLPYEDNNALFIDVPKNQPNGTLVLTHPMNGCALSVYETADKQSNRFFHDADGKALINRGLPPGTDSNRKYLLEETTYAGANRPTEVASVKLDAEESQKTEADYVISNANFEYTIVSIKRGSEWFVYNTALITGYTNDDEGTPVKIFIRCNEGIESDMKSFPD